jgi:hypothetical protein
LVAELKDQLQRAEAASDQYQKQLEILKIRLDDVLVDQTKLEEKEHQRDEEIQSLKNELKDFAKQKKEMEQLHDSEKAVILKERDEQATKEEELQAVIRRLNETLKQREHQTPRPCAHLSSLGLSVSADQLIATPIQHDPTMLTSLTSPSTIRDGRDQVDEILQKDRTINALQLELADIQIKVAELEHMGDGRLQELEKALLEARVTNARLMEDNESFQLLLSEKTLKGDFLADAASSQAGLESLADELESIQEGTGGESDANKTLEGEVKSLRDSNKALTLYIDKIIGRLLQHEGFEHIINEKDDPPEVPEKPAMAEKALPPPPSQAAPSLLQRAKSVVSRPAAPKARPMSVAQPPTAHENPETAPSIPLNRGHRRSRSDQTETEVQPAAAAVVGQMYRGSPLRTISGGPTIQGISPALSPSLGPRRTSYFQSENSFSGRTPSSGGPLPEQSSSSNSIVSERSGDAHSTEASSAPQTSSSGMSVVPGAVMRQNQLRPLRLVREQRGYDFEEDAAKKAANRGSWLGFFKGASIEAVPKSDA